MSVSRPVHVLHRMVASVSIFALLSSNLPAQTTAAGQNGVQISQTSAQSNSQASAQVSPQTQAVYTTPLNSYTQPNPILSLWRPYAPHGLPQPVLNNSDRLHTLLKDGKLMLSLNDAVALALENNFDIAIARYNLNIADTDLLLAKSGGTVRGISTGLLTGTPGGAAAATSTAGSTGGGAGGTTTGPGGSATGSGGLVLSTQNSVGSPIDSYDPILTGTLSLDRQLMPIPNPVLYGGVTSLRENTNQYNFNYAQGWATGTLAASELQQSEPGLAQQHSTASFFHSTQR